MNNAPLHYLPSALCRMFAKNNLNVELMTFHPTADGWVAILRCSLTGTEYKVTLDPIRSEVEVGKPMTFSELMKQIGGGYGESINS